MHLKHEGGWIVSWRCVLLHFWTRLQLRCDESQRPDRISRRLGKSWWHEKDFLTKKDPDVRYIFFPPYTTFSLLQLITKDLNSIIRFSVSRLTTADVWVSWLCFWLCCSVRVRGRPLDGWGLLWLSVSEWSQPQHHHKVHNASWKLPGHWGDGPAIPGGKLSAGANGGGQDEGLSSVHFNKCITLVLVTSFFFFFSSRKETYSSLMPRWWKEYRSESTMESLFTFPLDSVCSTWTQSRNFWPLPSRYFTD